MTLTVEPRAFKIPVERTIRYKRALQKTDELRRELRVRGVLGDMVGASPAMQEIFSIIRQVAPTSAPVLICGETGTASALPKCWGSACGRCRTAWPSCAKR